MSLPLTTCWHLCAIWLSPLKRSLQKKQAEVCNGVGQECKDKWDSSTKMPGQGTHEAEAKMFLWRYRSKTSVSIPRISAILLLIYLTGTPGQKYDISFSWGFVHACAEYQLCLEPDINKTNIFWGNSKLGVSHVLCLKVFLVSLGINCLVMESWCELCGTYTSSDIYFHGLSWVCLYPACKQTFWASLEIKTFYFRNILRNWGRGWKNFGLEEH